MRKFWRRRKPIGAYIVAIAPIAVLLYVPAVAGLALAALAALSWCFWLERHPSA